MSSSCARCELEFPQKTVLDGVSLKVEPLDRLVIMGQSGSGKSTILRLILGILQPSGGRDLLQAIRDLAPETAQAPAGPHPDRDGLSVFRASQLAQRARQRRPAARGTDHARPTAEIDKIVDEKLELVGMIESKNQMPSELSGGMRKRVSLARALVMDPELILFDEPSAGLDPVISSVIDELIISLTERSPRSPRSSSLTKWTARSASAREWLCSTRAR